MRNYLLHPRLLGAMAGCLLLTSAVPPAYALPSESVAAVSQQAAARTAQIDRIMQVLSTRQAQWHLRLMGLNSATLRAQLEQLDDAQLATVAQQAETVRAAGDPLIIIGISLGSIVFIALVVALIVLIVHESNQNKSMHQKAT